MLFDSIQNSVVVFCCLHSFFAGKIRSQQIVYGKSYSDYDPFEFADEMASNIEEALISSNYDPKILPGSRLIGFL